MRIAYANEEGSVNAFYRSAGPMIALHGRGHEVRQLRVAEEGSRAWTETLRWCEVLHVHRLCDDGLLEHVRQARAGGAAVVWDDDDDVTKVPKGMPGYKDAGGVKGQRRLAVRRRLFKLVDLVTTSSPHLAEVFREGGAPRVQVVENFVSEHDMGSRAPSAKGVVVGWVAGKEHALDLPEVPVQGALRRLLDRHADLEVRAIGVDLALDHERYRHIRHVPYPDLLREVSAFDVGIAPLAGELAINKARSNVKLKEYAAAGVPWLASPAAMYRGMGEEQGGRLVPDDRWEQELEELIAHPRRRRKLAKRAAKWGRTQTVERNAHLWEEQLRLAIERARQEWRAA